MPETAVEPLPSPEPEREPLKSVTPLAWGCVALFAALLGYAFREPMIWMYDRWVAEESYYSHGFLVPPVALYIMWLDRRNLAALPVGRSLIGLAVFLAGFALYFMSGFFVVYFTSAFALVMMLWGLAGFVLGWPIMKRLVFPAFVLLFMVPLPLAMIAAISLKMKMLATHLALVALNVMGIVSDNDGATIYLGDEVVTVGSACSGLRSLIALIFMGVLAAYFSRLSMPRRLLICVLSVPIAIVANIVRVLGLCLYVYYFGSENAEQFERVHDISGYLIYVADLVLLFLTVQLLTPRGGGDKADATPVQPNVKGAEGNA